MGEKYRSAGQRRDGWKDRMFGMVSAIGKIPGTLGRGETDDVSGEIPGLRKRLMIETALGGVKGEALWNS